MENTHIEWADHTFNPWIGCTKVSPGCLHCYAEARDLRFAQGKHWGKGAPRQRTSAANWREPLKWNKTWRPAIEPRRRVFCASLADWLDDEVQIEWLADLLKLIHDTPNLDWLLLTKRPGNWSARLHEAFGDDATGALDWVSGWLDGEAPANIWIGATIEDQARANERIPQLLDIPAKVRFLSCEPLLESLGKINFHGGDYCDECCATGFVKGKVCPNPIHRSHLHWVICGGESGPDARPMHPDWARSLRDQCNVAYVDFFFKQWGEWFADPKGTHLGPIGQMPAMHKIGKRAAGRLLDGREWNEVPA